MTLDTVTAENAVYQRWLAESLVVSLGLDGAIAASQRQGWYGVLDCLLKQRERGAGLAEPQAPTARAA
jgi:hypothetical protein